MLRGEIWRVFTFLFAPRGPLTLGGLLWTALGLWLLHTMGSALDPRIPPDKKERGDYTASQAIVLACKPYDWIDDFPKTNVASAELRAEVLAKWKDAV